jgi:hypothetical protein
MTTEQKSDPSADNQLDVSNYFPTLIYTIKKPEYLHSVREVFNRRIAEFKKNNSPDRPIMSSDISGEESIIDFLRYASNTGWNILDSQGHQMTDKLVIYESIWGQQYHKKSQMEQHVHGNGVQLVGFYFLDVPKDCPKILIHDPRPGKVQINLPEKDTTQATPASTVINFAPVTGMFFFAGPWLAHSFTQNESTKPFNFIHFNLTAIQNPNTSAMSNVAPQAEII